VQLQLIFVARESAELKLSVHGRGLAVAIIFINWSFIYINIKFDAISQQTGDITFMQIS